MKAPTKRTKEARSWEGGSVTKQNLESLDCSGQANGSNGIDSLSGDSRNVDVSQEWQREQEREEGRREGGGKGRGEESKEGERI